MNRLLGGILAATFAIAACGTGTPGTSPGTGGSPAAGDGQAALTELCGTGDASLGSLATELEGIDASTDTTQVSTSIGTAIDNLEDADVDANATTARDAAITALQALQTALNDPNTREQVATQAASALRALEPQICA